MKIKNRAAGENIFSEETVASGDFSNHPRITVAVAGVCHRMGTSTVATRLAMYLFYVCNKNVAYVEENNTGLIQMLEKRYLDTKRDRDGNLVYNRLPMIEKSNILSITDSNYDYLVMDYGSVHDEAFDETAFMERNVQILICGSSPNELEYTASALQNPYLKNSKLIFNLVPPIDQKTILEDLKRSKREVFFTGYMPDLFEYDTDMDLLFSQLIPESVR